ncbi:hypothetical protein FACS189499_01720 [Clostridia bacterium]|nr:hypothetical protein FACS189499_01720 [Clostridia bacterium]
MEIVQLVFSLIGVFGLMFLMIYLLKRLQKSGTISGRNLRVLERTVLDRDVHVFVVSVYGKVFLLGATKANVTMLSELPADYLNTPDAPGGFSAVGSDTGNAPPTFAEALAANLAGYLPKRKKKPPKARKVPDFSEVPDFSDLSDFSDLPEISEISEISETAPETPDCETDPCETCELWIPCDECEADSCDDCGTSRSCDNCMVAAVSSGRRKKNKQT